MARPERFELPTYSSGGCRSIQLSYGRVVQVYMGCEHAINLRPERTFEPDGFAAMDSEPRNRQGSGADERQHEQIGLPPSSATLCAATTSAFGFGARFVYIDRASPKLSAVEPRDGLLALFVIRHFDEAEASRPACLAISQNARTLHMSISFEKLAQLVFGRVEAEIANEDVFQVASFFLSLRTGVNPTANRRRFHQDPQVRREYSKSWNLGKWASL